MSVKFLWQFVEVVVKFWKAKALGMILDIQVVFSNSWGFFKTWVFRILCVWTRIFEFYSSFAVYIVISAFMLKYSNTHNSSIRPIFCASLRLKFLQKIRKFSSFMKNLKKYFSARFFNISSSRAVFLQFLLKCITFLVLKMVNRFYIYLVPMSFSVAIFSVH